MGLLTRSVLKNNGLIKGSFATLPTEGHLRAEFEPSLRADYYALIGRTGYRSRKAVRRAAASKVQRVVVPRATTPVPSRDSSLQISRFS